MPICRGKRGCGKEKPADEFSLIPKGKDGLNSICNECSAERRRKYYANNTEKETERRRKHYANNKEKETEYFRKYRENNPEKIAERGRLHRNVKPLGRLKCYKHSAKIRNKEWFISDDLAISLFHQDCTYCGRVSNPELPLVGSLNGIDRMDPTLGYLPHNVTPACDTCNMGKQSLQVYEFHEWIGRCHVHKNPIDLGY